MRRAILLLLLAACTRPAEERALADLEVGRAEAAGLRVEIDGGLAHVRALTPGALHLWAQAPVLDLTVDAEAAGTWTITVDNALADATLTGAPATTVAGERPTRRVATVALPAGVTRLRLAPPDADDPAPWRFAAMADIQGALPQVHEVFARINATPDVRFVISMGDITDRAEEEEYVLWEQQLTTLDVPFYATIGNHELMGSITRWQTRFGRTTVHFDFRDVAFSLIDSGSATVDPLVDDWIDDWLAGARDRVHVFATHYPPFDPIGVRQGSFASRREGQALLARLAAGGVDLTLYGHLHTYSAFDNAGIPAHISGGGGADPMRFDGIDRHFLTVDVDPAAGAITAVDVVRVD